MSSTMHLQEPIYVDVSTDKKLCKMLPSKNNFNFINLHRFLTTGTDDILRVAGNVWHPMASYHS